MELSIQIIAPSWKPVYVIKAGTTDEELQTNLYKSIRDEVGNIKNHFLCYSWSTVTEVKYCGSIARDYRHEGYKSNLEGRVHNYFKNHRQEPNGRKNANLNVYENIRITLKESDVILSILVFEKIVLGKKSFTYNEYSEIPEIIQAVEQLLICYYKDLDQSPWNRTPSSRMKNEKVKIMDQPVDEPSSQLQPDLIERRSLLNHLIHLKGEVFSTLGNDKKFKIIDIDTKAVYVVPESTGNLRPIPMREFVNAWKYLMTHKQIYQGQIFELGGRNSAYVATILSTLPGVTFKKKPVRLMLP